MLLNADFESDLLHLVQLISWLQSNNVGKIWLTSRKNAQECFVRHYMRILLTTNGLIEDTAWGTEMVWATGWIHVAPFAQVCQIFNFVSVKQR